MGREAASLFVMSNADLAQVVITAGVTCFAGLAALLVWAHRRG